MDYAKVLVGESECLLGKGFYLIVDGFLEDVRVGNGL